MTKTALMINTIEEINYNVDAIIIGIEGYNSLNILEVNYDNLKKLLDKVSEKEIYVSMNQIIHEEKQEELRQLLKKLSNLNIDGILFDDPSIYQIIKDNNLNIPLVWCNIHQTTNYLTINTWNKIGTIGTFISPDITLNEIFDIRKNTASKMFVPIYGYFDIFNSNRFLITNYLKYINNNKNNNNYYINHIDTKYPIYEDKNGTHIINGNLLSGIDEYPLMINNKIDYILINTYNVDNINKVIDIFNSIKDNPNIVNVLINNDKNSNNKGFYYKETYYKVKDGDNNE